MSTKRKSSLVTKILVTFVITGIWGALIYGLIWVRKAEGIKHTQTPLGFWESFIVFTLIYAIGIVIEWHNPKSNN